LPFHHFGPKDKKHFIKLKRENPPKRLACQILLFSKSMVYINYTQSVAEMGHTEIDDDETFSLLLVVAFVCRVLTRLEE